MDDDEYKQIMFSKTEGFWKIVYGLEYEISFFINEGDIIRAYPRIKHLYAFVCAHFKKEGIDYRKKFKEIEDLLYDSQNKKFSTMAKARKLSNYRKADELMFELYVDLKRQMKESDMELYYGTPKDVIIKQKQDANINKVFGRNK